MKKLLSVLVCLSMLVSVLTFVPVHAATSGTCGPDLTWSYDTNTKVLTISGTGEMNDYPYQDAVSGYPIRSPWASYYKVIETIVIEEGVTYIGECAFYGMYSLKNVSIANSVSKFGMSVFDYCNAIQATELDNVKYLGNDTNPYLYLHSVTDKTITSFEVGADTKLIGDFAFSGCNSLTNVIIPTTVTCIGYNAFYCNNITDLTLGCVNEKLTYSFNKSRSTLKNLTILEGATSIPESFCDYFDKIENFSLPASVKIIETYAFLECTSSMKSISIPDLALWCDVELKTPHSMSLPLGSYDLYVNGELLSDLVIPDGITDIKDYTFARVKNFITVTIPDSVKTIGYRSFFGCKGETLKIGNGVKTIPSSSFEQSGFKSADIGSSVTSINSNAFLGCENLTEITFRSTPYIYKDAFSKCTSLTDVYVVGTSEDWNEIKANCEDGNAAIKTATVHYIEDDPCADGHDYVVTVVPATSEAQGYTLHTCSRCGDSYTDNFTPVISDTDALLRVETVDRVLTGGTFTVTVSAENNPGINSFTIGVNYDRDKLTLDGAEKNPDLDGNFVFTQKAVWVSSGDYTEDGVLFTLTFTAKEDAAPGATEISLSYAPVDISNFYEDDVAFNMVPATVNVIDSDHTPGDINGDGAVNSKDLTRMIRVFAGDDITYVDAALDVNGDGSVNTKDLVRLMRYLSGDTVTIC